MMMLTMHIVCVLRWDFSVMMSDFELVPIEAATMKGIDFKNLSDDCFRLKSFRSMSCERAFKLKAESQMAQS